MTTRTIVSNHRPNPENTVTATSTTRPRGTRLPRLARRRQLLDESVGRLVEAVTGAIRSTTDNRQRVNATFAAYFEYVAEHSGTFKLVFESDFSNEPAVRARLDAANRECADLISQVIREDAGLADDEAYLLSIGLLGMAQVSARYWLSTFGSIPKETAEQLVGRLAWRGISGWPRTSDQGEAH